MTLLVRDEADVVDAQLAFHLNAGVDFVVATDNASHDGTTEILECYERAGHLHLIREHGDDMRQSEWVTRMARLAATEFGADWVINSDADEFWWPRSGSLKDVLAAVPERFGLVRGAWRHFLPRPDDGGFFAERMTVRLRTPAFSGDKRTIFHAHQKVAHRARPDVTVEAGNHNADGWGLEPLRTWHPIEVLHFSLRSVRRLVSKGAGGWLRNPAYDPPEHQLRLAKAYQDGTLDAFYREHAVDDDEVERGLIAGTLAIDTRVRDVLRLLRAPDGSFTKRAPEPLSNQTPDLVDTADFAAEISTLAEIDGIVRAERRVSALEERLEGLEGMRRRLARR